MVAQAALKFNPSAAASELYRVQQKQRRSQAPRGKVLRFPNQRDNGPPAVPVGLANKSIIPSTLSQSSLDTAPERMNIPSASTVPANPAPANNTTFFDQVADRQQREEQIAFMREKNRRIIEAQRNSIIPSEILAAGKGTPEEQAHEAIKITKAFESKVGELSKKLGDSPAFKKQVQGAKQEAVKAIKELGKKSSKKAVQVIWRGIGDAAPFDIGEVAYIELVFGSLVQAYRLTVTFFAIKKRGVGGTFAKYASDYAGSKGAKALGLEAPEENKGIIAELLPGEMDLVDPTTWLADIPLAILGMFMLLVAIGIIHLFLMLLGMTILGGAYAASFLGGILG